MKDQDGSIAACAPGRVLPPDHPIRVLGHHQEALKGTPAFTPFIRAIAASTKAHIRKKYCFHHLAAEAADDLRAATVGMSDGIPELAQDLWFYHKARSGPVVKIKGKVFVPGPPNSDPSIPVVLAVKKVRPKRQKDEVAFTLLGIDLNQAYEEAARALGDTTEALKARYGHLNPGLQRMNLGNRLRAQEAKANK